MSNFYISYPIADKAILDKLVKKGYIEYPNHQIGYTWTDKGANIMNEFVTNLANLGEQND